MTVIGKAKELIKTVGKDKAIEFFQNRIGKIGQPKDFGEQCKISAAETAIKFINEKS